MSLAGSVLLTGFSDFIGDLYEVTASDTGSTTTLVDTSLRKFGEDKIINWYLRPTGSTNQYEIKRITGFAESSGTATVAPGFTSSTAAEAYGLHKYDPQRKFAALDRAAKHVYPTLAQLVYDDTLTADGTSDSFDIPSAVRFGPSMVYTEHPIAVDQSWNFITDPRGDSTSSFTGSSAALTTYDVDENDLMVPKYGWTATRMVVAASTAATVRQVVGDMNNDITAAIAAGREMTTGVWVYSRTADKIAVEIVDDGGQLVVSSQHGGAGWELLTATATVSSDNSSTLTVGLTLDNDASAFDGFWNHWWFYFGDASRIRDIYPERNGNRIRFDDTTQRIYMDFIPLRGRQLRLVGRDVLSALGTTAGTQVTNTMEVDVLSAELLYAAAARILFGEAVLNSSAGQEMRDRILLVEDRFANTQDFAMPQAARKALKGPWAR